MLKSIAPSYIRDLLKYKNLGSVLQSSSKHLLDELLTNLKTHMVIGHTPLLLQNCGISYHWTYWTSGYHRSLVKQLEVWVWSPTKLKKNNRPCVELELHSAHGRTVKKWTIFQNAVYAPCLLSRAYTNIFVNPVYDNICYAANSSVDTCTYM